MTFGEEIVSRLMQLERDVRDLKTFELNHVSKFKIDNNLDVIGNLNVSGTAQIAVDLDVTGLLKHKAVSGGIYVPVTATDLRDSAGNLWNGAFTSVSGTTYTFRPGDNSNIWSSSAKAVILLVQGQWAAAASGNNFSIRKNGSSTGELLIRAYVAAMNIVSQGIIQVDANGYFIVVVAGANASASVCRILGYFI